MSLLVVGSVAFDSLRTPRGEAKHILGGAATHFSVTASYFTSVKVVAVVGGGFCGEQTQDFHHRGGGTAGGSPGALATNFLGRGYIGGC